MDPEFAEYKKDSRIPCKYGSKCFQKNPAHHGKYKHPPKTKRKHDINPGLSKKLKLSDNGQEKADQVSNSEAQGKAETKLETTNTSREKEETTKECISDSLSESEDEVQETKSDGDESNQVAGEERKVTECISDSLSESDEKPETPEIATNKAFDSKQFIKARFLVDMPEDFYDFWDYCKDLKPNNPCEAFKDVGLILVGAYDVLAGKFKHVKKPPEQYLRHWRYYYDPPELQTVLKGNNTTGYHIGYFYDSPDEPPPFLASNHGTKDGVFTKMGDNIFAAVSIYLEELKKTGDPFKKMHVGRLLGSIKTRGDKLKLNLSSHSPQIKKRESKVVTRTFNKIGLVVPYEKKTQLGYRDLAMADKELMTLLNKLDKAVPEQKSKYLSDLQPVLTYANIALDECDFGTGIKLGWELLYHGIDSLNSTILQFFCNSYRLLNKEAFAKIAEAHLGNRKKGCDLSIL